MEKGLLLGLRLLCATAGCDGSEAADGPSLDAMAQAEAPAPATLDMMALAPPPVAVTRATPPRATDVDSALARLPEGAGAIKAVRERFYPNGYSQDIALDSDAPGAVSHIVVAIQTGRALASSGEKVPVWKPGEAGVKAELAREFPNLPMHVVVNGGYENSYGRFGVAIGREGDALRCVYAWQYVDDARRAFGHGQRMQPFGAQASADQSAPAALRVKLCRADSTVDDLVAEVKALVVDIPDSIGAPPPVASRTLSARAPRIQAARAEPHHAPRPHSARRAPRVEPDARPVQPAYAVAAQPAYVAAPVAQAYAPSQFQPAQIQNGRIQTGLIQTGLIQTPGAAGGPRYLAPVAPVAVGGGMAASAGLNQSLPPQAYRGPGVSRGPIDSGAPAPQNPYQRVSARGDAASVPTPASAPPQSPGEGAPRIIPLAAAQ